MIIFDTNVLSELAKPVAELAVIQWANTVPIENIYTTAITEAEILFGLGRLPAGRRQETLRRAIETVFSTLLAGRVLPFDRASAQAYAELAVARRRDGRPTNTGDLQIAAIGRAYGARAIATRNSRDFEGYGIELINPWQEPPSAAV